MTKLALFLIGLVTARADREWILGDTIEEFERIETSDGRTAARRWLRGELFRVLRHACRQRLARRRLPRQAPPTRGDGLMSAIWQDVRYAVRALRQSPGFTAVATLTLALGIGANCAIFALVDATLLRPLPFPDPERLVMVWERSATSLRSNVAPLNLLDWNERNRTFDLMAGLGPGVGGMVMSSADGTPETVPRQWVLAGFFEVLGVEAIAGRTFLPEDDRRRASVVVLSEAFWRTRFGADRTVIGRDIRLDGSPYTVIGVVPNPPQLLGRTSIWALVSLERNPELRTAYFLHVIGRLKPGVTIEAARSDMTAVARGLAQELPTTNKGRGIELEPLHQALIGSDLRLTSMLFLGVVGVVLLICCANVANLLLTRATARRRELAIRSALGAGQRRIIRQLLTESLVLSAMGGLLGAGVGAAILAVAPLVIPQELLPGAVTLTFDLRVVAFCAAAALLVGLLFGLAPASQAGAFSSARAFTAESRTTTGRSGGIRSVLVVGEVATAVVLLVGAGLLLRTLMAVESIERGYRAGNALTMLVDPLGERYPTDEAMLQFFDDVEREIRALPGIQSVAWTGGLPLGTSLGGQSFFEIVGAPPVDRSERPTADYQIVSHTYFETLDLPVVEGRAFNDRDTSKNVPVCIVNEAFVRGYFRGQSPIGRRIAIREAELAQAPSVEREIVGVARQVKGRPDETEDVVQIYVPMAQQVMGDIFLVVRPSSGRADALASPVRAAIARVDKEQLVSVRDVTTLANIAWDATARHRFRAVMVITFAALAVLLAMVGLFGVLAYSVQQRLRDFGVRKALGATTSDLLRLVIWSGARLIAAGTAIGLLLSVAFGRLLATMLFGVEPLDPITFASAAIVLGVTAAAAIVTPAWRAAHIDPAVALRSE